MLYGFYCYVMPGEWSLRLLLQLLRSDIEKRGNLPLWQNWKLLRVKGNSMAPTLLSGHIVQMRPFAIQEANHPRSRGLIVALRHPLRSQAIYLKRVIGLPNEHVALAGGKVEVDGRTMEEPYLRGKVETLSKGANQWFTDAGEVFVLGDNRGDSEDSRAFGPVPLELIVGQVCFRYFPPTLLR